MAQKGGDIDLNAFRPAMDSRGYITVNASQVLGHKDSQLNISTYGFKGWVDARFVGEAPLNLEHVRRLARAGIDAEDTVEAVRWSERLAAMTGRTNESLSLLSQAVTKELSVFISDRDHGLSRAADQSESENPNDFAFKPDASR